MSRKTSLEQPQRRPVYELLEAKLALSAQPLADVADWLGTNADPKTETLETLSTSTQFEEVAAIRQQYGFTGKGQTVAVIDSGIAWDHLALGAGFGSAHQVVGGWDFAENDANPYDDGPFGFHGTHVAGIIGNTDATRYGVASGVDLVALRVFNDQGVSDFRWIEQALQWVHQHKDDFANPITTVNLSVGSRENLNSLPALATLDDELAQLRQDGIFIAVAAGNAFQTYQSVGLTYPAISPHVVAVGSHDADGSISDFSQRASNVLLAPGRGVLSTVPNHTFAGSQTNGFLLGTGTSMAAPYVAGASVLVREALTFMGVTDVDQQTINDRFRATAEKYFDPATQQNYYRLNLSEALMSVIGDDHSAAAAQATDLGRLADRMTAKGTIGSVSDIDQFTFAAQLSGRVTLSLSTTQALSPEVTVNGVRQTIAGNQLTFDVASGQNYTLSVSTNSGIGHYNLALQLERPVPVVDWGPIGQRTFENIAVSGEQWFRFRAGNPGWLSVEALQTGGITQIELYNDQQQLVGKAIAGASPLRLDVLAKLDESYSLRVVGSTDQLAIRITNLVSLNNGLLQIAGTNRNDRMTVDTGSNIALNINDVPYQFDTDQVQRLIINGYQGIDEIEIRGGSYDERFRLDVGVVRMIHSQLEVVANDFERILIDGGSETGSIGGSGFDVAMVNGGWGAVQLTATADGVVMVAGDFHYRLANLDRVRLTAKGADAVATLFDSAGDDRVIVREATTVIRTSHSVTRLEGFSQVAAHSVYGGLDVLRILDTASDDRLRLSSGVSTVGDFFRAFHFESVVAAAGAGFDSAIIDLGNAQQIITDDRGGIYVPSVNWSVRIEGFDLVDAICEVDWISLWDDESELQAVDISFLESNR